MIDYENESNAQTIQEDTKLFLIKKTKESQVFYYQNDERWKDIPLGGKECPKETIGNRGCFIVALANIMHAEGVDINPQSLLLKIQQAKQLDAQNMLKSVSTICSLFGLEYKEDRSRFTFEKAKLEITKNFKEYHIIVEVKYNGIQHFMNVTNIIGDVIYFWDTYDGIKKTYLEIVSLRYIKRLDNNSVNLGKSLLQQLMGLKPPKNYLDAGSLELQGCSNNLMDSMNMVNVLKNMQKEEQMSHYTISETPKQNISQQQHLYQDYTPQLPQPTIDNNFHQQQYYQQQNDL